MWTNQNYFNKYEEEGYNKLIELANNVTWFKNIDKLFWKAHADASGMTRDERKVIIELKDRNYAYDEETKTITKDGKHYKTVFIESHKIASLLLDSIDGFLPLYVNFMNNGYVLIFVLTQLKTRPVETDEMNIRSKGYNSFEVCKRQGLSIEDAIIIDLKKKRGKNGGN